jgi:hypothetical protein
MDWRNSEQNAEFYIKRGKKNLVVTIGDSWTFGDSLGSIADTQEDDFNSRSTQVYGRYLADELNADWVNCGYCGRSNSKIIEKLYGFVTGLAPACFTGILSKSEYNALRGKDWPAFNDIPYPNNIRQEISELLTCSSPKFIQLPKQYDNVYYFITLTETGRNSGYYDFIKDRRTNNFLKSQEQVDYDNIQYLVNRYNINLVVGRNFTVNYNSTNTKNINILPKNWVQINYEHNIRTNSNGNILSTEINCNGPASGIAFKDLKELDYYKEYLINQMAYVNQLWLWLRNNPLHYNRATCHPKKESHLLWAKYLLDNMNS